jgi:hypothetical protein
LHEGPAQARASPAPSPLDAPVMTMQRGEGSRFRLDSSSLLLASAPVMYLPPFVPPRDMQISAASGEEVPFSGRGFSA